MSLEGDPIKFIQSKGFLVKKLLAKTLQGFVYDAKYKTINVVIKVTCKKLHMNKVAVVNGTKYIIKENVVKEAKLMKYLESKKPLPGFLKLFGFYQDKEYYYLVMEHGGLSLFEYIDNKIQNINKSKNNIKLWQQHIKKLFKQMVLYINWLHNNNCCHLDISLENCVIKNNIINFCDFGLAEYFPNKNNFKTNKFCGKLKYECPEIFQKKIFDGRKADIWSLGVTLVMMLTGAPIYEKPSLTDPYFENLNNGYLKEMHKNWDLIDNMSDSSYDLLNGIFKPEKQRMSIKDILKHKFIASTKLYS